ncbi:MAG: lysoplasmalogenase family protein [Sphingorhabdus sp.]
MAQDLAHKRPWLLASLAFGLTYPASSLLNIPGTFEIIWKMLPLALLIPYALRRHHSGEFAILAVILALCSMGDGLVEISLELGAIAFGLSHLAAIWLYGRNRRDKTAFSQKFLALTVIILAPLIAYQLAGGLAAGYTLLLAAMAAMAWSSNFPRYRVGIGAMLFVISDLLIFAREGQGVRMPIINPAIWYLYYVGMVMIATGVVQTLVKRGHHVGDTEDAVKI